MKRILTPLLIATLAMPAWAQKAKQQQPAPQQLIQQYRFAEAVTALQTEIATAKRRRKPTEELEELQARAQRLQVMLEGTQQITFVDSVVADKKRLLESLHLGSESGTLTYYSRAFGKSDTLGCTVYQSQLANLTLFAKPTDGRPMLHSSALEGGSWSEPAMLRGLDETDECQNFPFMLSDGATLYYGAVNPEGMGGYDIYFSRYDNEEGVFRNPENAGMPFNSLDNDYMLCIDDFNNLGYLVTDRRQPQGKVCIYTFIPPTVRVNYADMGTEGAQLRNLAAISSIAATQTDKQAVAEARQRIAGMSAEKEGERSHDFTFVVNDARVYHFASDFKDKEARRLIAQWQKDKAELENTGLLLEAARQTYSTVKADRRTAMRQQILTMETAYEQGTNALHELEKEIRNHESKKLK